MTEDFAETLRRLDRYPGRGDRLDPTVVVRAARRRLRTRRLGAVTGAGALVVALAIAGQALLVGRPTSVPPVGGTPPALTQAPRPVGRGQSAVLIDDIQAVNVPATTSDGALVAGDVAGWSLSATPGTRDLLHWGWPGVHVSWSRTVRGGSGGAEWTLVDGAPTLARLSTGQADDSGANAVVVSGAVPSAIPDPEVVLTSAAGFDLGTRGAVTTVEVPTFATRDGRLLYAVVLRGAAATRFAGAAWQVLVVGSDGKPVVAGCGAARCNVAPLTSSGLDGPQVPITRFSPAPAEASTAPPTPTPPMEAPADAAAPRPAQLAVGAEAATGLSSRAGDLSTVDATATGEYYLAGDLAGASVRVGVATSGPAPQITVFAVSGTASTLSPATPPTWAPVTDTIPRSWAVFPDDKDHSFATGITPAGAPHVFLVATWGFDRADGSRVHALEVPTFAPPATAATSLAPDQRMWVMSDPGAPDSVGSGWSGYVYASSDGTLVDPSCADATVPQDSCARDDLSWFGAYDEIRAMLAK